MARTRSDEAGGWLRLLTAQSTGILCAFSAAALLATGSFVMDRSPDLYAGLTLDDLRFFARPWRWQHVWLYGLVAVLAVWAASAFCCAFTSLRGFWQRRAKDLAAYGPPLLHLVFGAALLAHLWGGLGASSREVLVSSAGTEIHGSVYRTLRLELARHRNGTPRSVFAVLERQHGQRTEEVRVGYNHPLVFAGGARELMFGEYQQVPDGVVLSHHGQTLTVRPGEVGHVGHDSIRVVAVHQPEENPSLRVPVLELQVSTGRKLLALGENDGETGFVSFHESPLVLLVERTNPSVPWVAALSLLLLLGVTLVGWGRLRALRRAV